MSEATYHPWRNHYGGMKSEEARQLKLLEDKNRRLKQLVADQALDIQMLKHVASETCRQQSRGAFGFLTATMQARYNGTTAPKLTGV